MAEREARQDGKAEGGTKERREKNGGKEKINVEVNVKNGMKNRERQQGGGGIGVEEM